MISTKDTTKRKESSSGWVPGLLAVSVKPVAGTPEAALKAGTKPYFRNVEEPWAYNATIKQDADGGFYFEAIVVEW